jgi:hypothetical protein
MPAPGVLEDLRGIVRRLAARAGRMGLDAQVGQLRGRVDEVGPVARDGSP